MDQRVSALLKTFTELLRQAEQPNDPVTYEAIAQGLENIRTGEQRGFTHHPPYPVNSFNFYHALYHGIDCKCGKDLPYTRGLGVNTLLEQSDLSERSIVALHAFFGMNDLLGRPVSYSAIGRHYGITLERARQIIERALQQIRTHHKIPSP